MKLRIWVAIGVGLVLARPIWGYVTSRIIGADQQIVQLKWAAFPIQWEMYPVKGSNVTGDREQGDVFQAAFDAWQAVPTATVSFVRVPAGGGPQEVAIDNRNVISTKVQQNLMGPGTLGLAIKTFYDDGEIVDADIIFNPDNLFSTNAGSPPPDRFDLQSIATHEIGHLLGLDHTSLTSAVMFWASSEATTFARTLSADDIAGVSSIYPAAGFGSKGTIRGTVRTTGNVAVYGAIVTAVNGFGQPVASAITDPQGNYTIAGLDAGAYTVYAEPLDSPLQFGNVNLGDIYPGALVNINFTTRFR